MEAQTPNQITAFVTQPISNEASNYDEVYMHQSLLFDDSLKDYVVKALVNTMDYLGSLTYKVNDLLDEKVVEVSVAEPRVSCIEQKFASAAVMLKLLLSPYFLYGLLDGRLILTNLMDFSKYTFLVLWFLYKMIWLLAGILVAAFG
ncbi:hypothetical protein RJT34_17285 [Clitoria ternatea]|uniref:Uncharacterized protein n=1 Tax=Clitoria ternatea TaxID=43366 RepID=A0AAN9PDM7_CLITE